MDSCPLPEVLSDVTLHVDLTAFRQPEAVFDTLIESPLTIRSTSSHLTAKGSFDEVDDAFGKLTCLETNFPKQRPRYHCEEQVPPVKVDPVIMTYIKQNCLKDLDRISGSEVTMDVGTQDVTFRPAGPDKDGDRAQFVRERFVRFYQKIATELQVRSYTLDKRLLKRVTEEFPEFVICRTQGEHKVKLMGRFIHFERFEELLPRDAKSSSIPQSHLAKSASNRASTGSPDMHLPQEQEDTCPICLETLVKSQSTTLPKCKHSFCRGCLDRAFNLKPTCPICGVLYGSLKGTQPDGGKMTVTKTQSSLDGHEKHQTIIINYHIPGGIQGEEHPNPGKRYEGTVRTAYIPDSPEGRKVLELLKRAFDQRLIFTIGQSSSSGRSNVVTWNDIHHKTSTYGGPTHYGYPDPEYLMRVQDELKAKGIY